MTDSAVPRSLAARTRAAGPHRRARSLVPAIALTVLATPAALVAGTQPVSGAATPTAAVTPAPCKAGRCWVDVSVATLWVRPWYPRPVDGPALRNPADPRGWLAGLTVAQRSWLVGKLETQALYGTQVTVIGHYGTSWTKVAVPSQPTDRDKRGYPGWVPTRQLTSTAPQAAATTAVIRWRTAWLWNRWTSHGVTGSRVLEVSYGTRLPVVRATSTYVEVALIGGRHMALSRSVLALHTAGTSWGATRAKIVDQARKFLGLQYLWAGTSGYGFDCSGLTHSVYRAFGITLPRDANRQAVHGTAVARTSLLPGDLVFFRGGPGRPIIHVGIYIGAGNMIDAPHTGAPVRIDRVFTFGYYAGARRYLTR